MCHLPEVTLVVLQFVSRQMHHIIHHVVKPGWVLARFTTNTKHNVITHAIEYNASNLWVWARNQGCPIDHNAVVTFARSKEAFVWLEQASPLLFFDGMARERTVGVKAAESGDLATIQWLFSKTETGRSLALYDPKCDLNRVFVAAIQYGHTDIIDWLIKVKGQTTSQLYRLAARFGQIGVIQWALECHTLRHYDGLKHEVNVMLKWALVYNQLHVIYWLHKDGHLRNKSSRRVFVEIIRYPGSATALQKVISECELNIYPIEVQQQRPLTPIPNLNKDTRICPIAFFVDKDIAHIIPTLMPVSILGPDTKNTQSKLIQYYTKHGEINMIQWLADSGIPIMGNKPLVDRIICKALRHDRLLVLEWLKSNGLQFSNFPIDSGLSRTTFTKTSLPTILWLLENTIYSSPNSPFAYQWARVLLIPALVAGKTEIVEGVIKWYNFNLTPNTTLPEFNKHIFETAFYRLLEESKLDFIDWFINHPLLSTYKEMCSFCLICAACKAGRIDIMEREFDKNGKGSEFGCATVFKKAVEYNQLKIAKWLYDNPTETLRDTSKCLKQWALEGNNGTSLLDGHICKCVSTFAVHHGNVPMLDFLHKIGLLKVDCALNAALCVGNKIIIEWCITDKNVQIARGPLKRALKTLACKYPDTLGGWRVIKWVTENYASSINEPNFFTKLVKRFCKSGLSSGEWWTEM
jgi:hypothetical protein